MSVYLLVKEGNFDILEYGHCGDEIECLKDEADFFATDFGEGFIVGGGDIKAVELVDPGGWSIKASEDVHEG